MHIVPAPVICAACHMIAKVDHASSIALLINDQVVTATIRDYPFISSLSIFVIHELDKIGSMAIAIVSWMIANAM